MITKGIDIDLLSIREFQMLIANNLAFWLLGRARHIPYATNFLSLDLWVRVRHRDNHQREHCGIRALRRRESLLAVPGD